MHSDIFKSTKNFFMKPIFIFFILFSVQLCFSQVTTDRTQNKRGQGLTFAPNKNTTTTQDPAPDPKVVAAYNWWKYINPNNLNILWTFSNVNLINYDTGVVAFSKRTAIGLSGWINRSIDIVAATNGDSLVHLEALANLEQLRVNGYISDKRLMHVRNLKNLKEFQVSITGSANDFITDISLSYIAQLTKLQKLHLYSCPKITDAGLKYLTALVNLKEFNLIYSGITDNGLGVFKSLSAMEELNLARTPGITDKGVDMLIDAIKNMKNFRKLIISFTGITAEGRQKLSNAGISFEY